MNKHNDALWDPRAEGDDELRRMETLLRPYGLLDTRTWMAAPRPDMPTRRRWTRWLSAAAVACIATAAVLVIGNRWRLDWQDAQPWVIAGTETRAPSTLAPGGVLDTAGSASLIVDVARIGTIELSPDSRLRLDETRAGHHRVALERGHLRASIWAPPGFFRVADAGAEVVDLGCDFDLWKAAGGGGRVFVRSGWVAYRVAGQDVLVPAGYAMSFDATKASTPLRPTALPALKKAVAALDRALAESPVTSDAVFSAAAAVADAAQDTDAYTLLTLLTQTPGLANSALYPRLANALHQPANDTRHRAAWAAGNLHAINAWWDTYPSQPKQWWANWRDALR